MYLWLWVWSCPVWPYVSFFSNNETEGLAGIKILTDHWSNFILLYICNIFFNKDRRSSKFASSLLSKSSILTSKSPFLPNSPSLQKGRAVHSGALVLALTKIQDIFNKYSGYQNGVITGYGVRRWCKILQPGCPRLTSAMRIDEKWGEMGALGL